MANCWENSGFTNGEEVATLQGFTCIFESGLTYLLRLVGLTTFIMIIIGGFKLLTAGDDPKAAEAGKKTLTSGIIGLVLAVASFFILSIIANFTGQTSLLQFVLGLE